MRNIKYIAAMLALVGTVGSVQASSEVNNEVNTQTIKHEIQFMNDSQLNEVVGAAFNGFNLAKAELFLTNAKNYGVNEGIYSLTATQLQNIKNRLKLLQGHKKVYSERVVIDWIFDELLGHVKGTPGLSNPNVMKHFQIRDKFLKAY